MDLARPARLGVVFEDVHVPRWQLDMLIELQQSALCEVYPRVLRDGRRSRRRRRLFGLYERLDRQRFAHPDDALSEAEISLDGEMEPPDGLDAVIWLPDLEPTPARAGPGVPVWYVAQGGVRRFDQKPLAEEVRSGHGAVHTELRCRDGHGDRRLLGSIGVTDRLSLHRARTRAYARAARLPLRHLRRVAHGVASLNEGPGTAPPRRHPPLFGTRVLSRLALRIAAQKTRRLLFREQWLIGYRRPGWESFRTIAPPRGVQYADPFPVQADGRAHLFFERFGQTGDGTISAVSITDEGHSEPESVLEADTHLSYPFPIVRDGNVLLMPETRRRRRVDLWRANDFPRGWEPDRVVLPHLPATDTTLFEHEGRVWLFTALAVDEGPAVDELHLFSAASLDGEWQPHPLNPVVADVHRARPAGALFVRDGELFRPAQDCSRAYGWRVVLNRVTVLTPDDFRDEPVATLAPDGATLTQLHTYSVGGEWEAIDVLRRVPRGPLSRRAPSAVAMSRKPFVSPVGPSRRRR